jgi:hypothetical protein
MEVAIPLLALGGMYVISNQQPTRNCNSDSEENNNVNENFDNMGKNTNYLPNTNIPPQNYPVPNLNQVIDDTVQNYPNPNTSTDKYFNQNVYENRVREGEKVSNNPQQIYSLTGNYLESEQFKHNNMVPFVGGKMRGYTYDTNLAESQLDNMVGSGSQTIKKIEQAPLFKPEDNMTWSHGTPNNSDFFQSRQIPGMINNNVKPFESQMVGPGLDKGYCVNGTGGYNSGLEARDKWLPPTVDELRIETNPKLEYELINHEGPANSYIKDAANIQTQGRVEKQRPDTYFINSQDRWLTTTGQEKGETLRSIQEMGIVKRNDIVTNYKGPAGPGDIQAGYTNKNYETSKRTIDSLRAKDIGISTAQGKGPSEDGDFHKKSHTNYHNNRSTIKQPDTIRSGFSAAIGAVIAPVMDLLKPTRKSENTNNIRVYGDVSTSVPNGYVYNPNDTTPTTIRETTQYETNFNINNQKEGIYINNYKPTDLTQRDTTSVSYNGPSGGGATQYGDMSYHAAYQQHNNDIKSATIDNRTNQGGTQIFNQQMNVINLKEDQNLFDGRMNPVQMTAQGPSVSTYGNINMPQYYDECQTCERIQPDILNAFRSNPYTHSLQTSV